MDKEALDESEDGVMSSETTWNATGRSHARTGRHGHGRAFPFIQIYRHMF